MLALDLFCGAGGASAGLHRAGFDLVGIDIDPQPSYPLQFIQADALHPPVDLRSFDLIWASPPCQAYSKLTHRGTRYIPHPALVAATRDMLRASGVPWIMENVMSAPMVQAARLCGTSLGLGALCGDGVFRPMPRHRLFEASFAMLVPPCGCEGIEALGVYGHAGGQANRTSADRRGYQSNRDERREAMRINWMSVSAMAQAVPPAYAEFLARQWLAQQ